MSMAEPWIGDSAYIEWMKAMSSTQVARWGKSVGDGLAALAVLLEAPLGADDPPLVLLAAAAEGLDRDRLAVQRVKVGLIVEGIDVARAAVHEQEDDALRLRWKRRKFRSEWVDERCHAVGRDGLTCEEAVGLQEARKRHRPEAAADLPEEFAPGAAAEGAPGDSVWAM